MKNYAFALLCAFMVFACEKEGEPDQIKKQQLQQQYQNGAERARKVDVCHNGHIINVSTNAAKAHKAHGDAIDLDGDGYFDQENSCSNLIDCNDKDRDVQGTFDWSGSGVDTNGNVYNLLVQMSCDFSVGTVDYEYCIGSLTLVSQVGNTYIYSETVTTGCVDNCTVTLIVNSNGSLNFTEDCGTSGILTAHLPSN